MPTTPEFELPPLWRRTADNLAGEVILQAEGDDDHFTIIAGVIANLAQYLADTVEPR